MISFELIGLPMIMENEWRVRFFLYGLNKLRQKGYELNDVVEIEYKNV